eukprot:TRINITY_DN32895_c0_g1_i1.p1 TRINITY_DN32895_c0_g1~~TRINITY_DN32895_c0_g1_i1.p1  ORF type:complete len:355 (+),score=64.38 TRINITY_DN32895_c0_g1_i1:30-1094(+)
MAVLCICRVHTWRSVARAGRLLERGIGQPRCRLASSATTSRGTSRSSWAEQLGSDKNLRSQAQPAANSGSGQVLSANRSYLAGMGGGRQVVLHDYRDVKFLKRVSAAGVAGTLMSSSGLAYAISLNMSPAYCAFLALQTLGSGFALYSYLRTYVARVVLDPNRSQLLVTGCSLFGYPRAEDDQLQLSQIRPGVDLSEGFIKFRLEGSSFDPSCWVWFRIPRAPSDGSPVISRPDAHVGFRPTVQPVSSDPVSEKIPGEIVQGHKFLGAGLDGSGRVKTPATGTWPQEGEVEGRSKGPRAPLAKPAVEAQKPVRRGPRKAILDMKLQNGLPASPQEEHKLLDLFAEPVAYGTTME